LVSGGDRGRHTEPSAAAHVANSPSAAARSDARVQRAAGNIHHDTERMEFVPKRPCLFLLRIGHRDLAAIASVGTCRSVASFAQHSAEGLFRVPLPKRCIRRWSRITAPRLAHAVPSSSNVEPGIFYAFGFLLTYEAGKLFDDIRSIGLGLYKPVLRLLKNIIYPYALT
jgi:hypothetical protein